jgi:serine/threonine protein kinase
MDDGGLPKLADFGLARLSRTHSSTMPIFTGTGKGSTRWTAPELFINDGQVTTQSDVWAFGCLCLEVSASGYIRRLSR